MLLPYLSLPRGFNKLHLQVEKAVERYRDQVENNERNTEELRAIMEVS